jgi:hypothetical protein
MKSQLPQLYAAIPAAVLLAACVPDTMKVDVQVSSPEQQPEVQASAAPPEPPTCMKPLTVAVGSTDAHMKTKQKFRIVGPVSVAGDYELRPLPNASAPPHSVLTDDYRLVKVSSVDYVIEWSVQDSTHGMVTPHIYDVVMESGGNGCPSKLTFTGQPHIVPGGDDDHAGHAVLN